MSHFNIFENLKKQHQEILVLTEKINVLANEKELFDPDTIRAAIDNLARELASHLAVEDEILYPLLAKNNKEDIRNTAWQFSLEFGDVMEAFQAYNRLWSDKVAISEKRDKFVSDSRTISTVIKSRIEKENKGLFSLIESGSAK